MIEIFQIYAMHHAYVVTEMHNEFFRYADEFVAIMEQNGRWSDGSNKVYGCGTNKKIYTIYTFKNVLIITK